MHAFTLRAACASSFKRITEPLVPRVLNANHFDPWAEPRAVDTKAVGALLKQCRSRLTVSVLGPSELSPHIPAAWARVE
jgi:hypothetical protein